MLLGEVKVRCAGLCCRSMSLHEGLLFPFLLVLRFGILLFCCDETYFLFVSLMPRTHVNRSRKIQSDIASWVDVFFRAFDTLSRVQSKSHFICWVLLSILLAFQSTPSAAQYFPDSRIKNLSDNAVGSQADQFRGKLAKLGFAIAEQRGAYWHDASGITSPPSKILLEELRLPQRCDDAECRVLWAYLTRFPPRFRSIYAHTYQFLWVEADGKIEFVAKDHLLWRGYK